MQKHVCTIFLSGLLVTLLNACSYSVSVNDNLVYTPSSLFTDFSVADANLFRCIEQTISDRKITNPKQLKLLNCSNAGIENLAGLEIFSELEELNLAENNLQRLEPLGQLARLKVVLLNKNKLVNIAPLLQLLHLNNLNLEDNPSLECTDVRQLMVNMEELSTRFYPPEQCHR
jgi:hypothetical protein